MIMFQLFLEDMMVLGTRNPLPEGKDDAWCLRLIHIAPDIAGASPIELILSDEKVAAIAALAIAGDDAFCSKELYRLLGDTLKDIPRELRPVP
jgi:hypothetical protein